MPNVFIVFEITPIIIPITLVIDATQNQKNIKTII